MARWIWLTFCLGCLPGCLIVETDVVNPIPEMSTVAIAPFFNLSQERSVDGRRFALAYYSELQKVPGYDVLPVGVVEQTMYDYDLQMNQPEDVIKLAELLKVDAVVVGAVTDYDPYYPPRIGMKVNWYSPRLALFDPGVPTEPRYPAPWRERFLSKLAIPVWTPGLPYSESVPPKQCEPDRAQSVIRPQSPENFSKTAHPTPYRVRAQVEEPQRMPGLPNEFPQANPQWQPLEPVVKIEPIMSYTRIFDGRDNELAARLRDYVEVNADLRSGEWEGYLYRSEDFIRFTSYVMIHEMLTLHGGRIRTRWIFKSRKFH